ncbi:nuclear transport factor 2 family protein [Nocardia sp. NPDC059228]|uniref:nuclear transport factor 2 family protein n=1 Tax=Nocardia sp. NPDC059228 TaxID=3346777 RepID=UPI00369E1B0C
MEDQHSLRTLRHRLPRRINDGQWHRVGELFSETAFLDYGELGRAECRPAIERYFASLPELIENSGPASGALVKQFAHAHDVQIEGDRATGGNALRSELLGRRASTNASSSTTSQTWSHPTSRTRNNPLRRPPPRRPRVPWHPLPRKSRKGAYPHPRANAGWDKPLMVVLTMINPNHPTAHGPPLRIRPVGTRSKPSRA